MSVTPGATYPLGTVANVTFTAAASGSAPSKATNITLTFSSRNIPGFGSEAVCWVGLGLLLLAPLIAIWRNCQALVMIFADFLSHQSPALARSRAAVMGPRFSVMV